MFRYTGSTQAEGAWGWSCTTGPVCVRDDNWHDRKHHPVSAGSASYQPLVVDINPLCLMGTRAFAHQTPKTSPPPSQLGGKSMQIPQQMRLWAVASPRWTQPCLILLRPEIIKHQCHLYLISSSCQVA